MRRKKQKQPELFTNVPPQNPKRPKRGTFRYFLARADAAETPEAAAGLGPALERLARLCRLLSADVGGGPFPLGTSAAAEVIGSGCYADGAAALMALVDEGLITRATVGSPQTGVSIWRWAADRPAPARLRYWDRREILAAAGLN